MNEYTYFDKTTLLSLSPLPSHFSPLISLPPFPLSLTLSPSPVRFPSFLLLPSLSPVVPPSLLILQWLQSIIHVAKSILDNLVIIVDASTLLMYTYITSQVQGCTTHVVVM